MSSISSMIIGAVVKVLGGGLVNDILSHLERRVDNETKRLEIETTRRQNKDNNETKAAMNDADNQARIIETAMQFRIFWVAWSIAAIPTVGWYAWGVLDSLVYGGTVLPDVAQLPPQLLRYADIVMNNVFYSGVAGMGIQALATVVRNR